MNRKMNRASLANGRKLVKLGWNKFEDFTSHAKTLPSYQQRTTQAPDRFYMNNIYIVQVYDVQNSWGHCEKAMIRRNDAGAIHSWSDFQRIKNEIWGPDRVALEVYPKARNLVDVANLYWIWILPEGFSCPIEVTKHEDWDLE